MLKKLIESYKSKRSVRNIEHHPVYGAVLSYLREELNDKSQGIGKYWSEEGKGKLIADILADVEKVINQQNPIMVVRMRLLDLMVMTAQFQVLVVPPPPEEDTSGLRKYEGITGELKAHIPALAKADKGLEEFFYGLKETPAVFGDLWDIILMHYWALALQMNAYNIVRLYLKDNNDNPDKDWFRPAFLSLCIWQEHLYREILELPSAISNDELGLKALMHSTWHNRVAEGTKEPRLEWEKGWVEIFREPSPYAKAACSPGKGGQQTSDNTADTCG